ncbi:glycine betaine transport integral membrane protein BetP [Mycobacterium tuberculosis EAS054]|uniref:BCCT family transporter n=1 Tax=Mycobacterium tuberculosis TaxID=1773 RepID=UPI0001901B1B|nr:BCCT family transporter [Mycobacterium tuberculosis]EFD60989.1 glycine betaine transport integral membrane protein BetP [Mycobacterium tuberculosis EAS054]KBF55852.1 glycine betaine transport integral membrane protein BetP [Mycobacterium tuberculosis EAS054]
MSAKERGDQNAVVDALRSIQPAVFIPASVVIVAMIVVSVVYSSVAENAFVRLNSAITGGVGWWYILVATGFVVFALYCGISRIGTIRLGRDDELPEFSFWAWLAMLFSAGMGIGLVFYGVAEPLSHYLRPPRSRGVPALTDAAANQAMALTVFHWGLHAWAIYVVVGLGIAYMTYQRGRPLSVRWLLEPVVGRGRVEGALGHAVDVIAIVGTLFGVATSLGFGITQIASGLEYLGWIRVDNWWMVGMIAAITATATASVVSGVSKGLKWLSNINMALAAALALFVLLLGPTLFLLQSWVQNLGGYVQSLPQFMLRTAPFSHDGWLGDWTIFYWGWWISWAPFVGMFIARISRGRTIREFIGAVLLVPTVIASLWFTIFGDSALLRQRNNGDMLVNGAVDTNTSLFRLLDGLPIGAITSVLAVLVIVFFFVTSSDSGSLVIDILSAGGELDPPKLTRVYWAVLEGVAAAVLLLIGGAGSLTALRTAAIATALPFSIVMVVACYAMTKAFHFDLAATPRLLHVTVPDVVAAGNRRRHDISATLSGLIAVRDVDSGTYIVHPDTGALTVTAPPDPLDDHVFESDRHVTRRNTTSSR